MTSGQMSNTDDTQMSNTDDTASAPLAHPEDLPLLPPDVLESFGRALVVAPHPDDESLGCGGAIALLRERGHDVRVLFITDGTMSHPSSRRYPAPKLAALREEEALAALDALGVAPEAAIFLRLQDRAVPLPGAAGFDAAVDRCRAILAAVDPATVLAPWRRDPHPDHRAAWHLIDAALRVGGMGRRPRLVEYPIWVWTLAEHDDLPARGEVWAWRLDIGAALTRKRAAITAHRSQTTDLIDDPTGFRLTPDILAHFAHPWELYVEAISDQRSADR